MAEPATQRKIERLAGNLAGGSDHFAFDRRLVNGSKSARFGNASAFRTRPQGRIQPFTADGRRRTLNGCPVSSAIDSGDSGNVALALRHRRRDWRDVFSGRGAGDGNLLHDIGRGRLICSRSLGKLVDDGRLWLFAHYFWQRYREEVRWLSNKH